MVSKVNVHRGAPKTDYKIDFLTTLDSSNSVSRFKARSDALAFKNSLIES